MAGDWIKMRADLFTHPKVDKIGELLGKDELYTVGALFAFWTWTDKHSVDGRVDGATSRLINRATRVDGLAEALVAVGWLVIDDKGITLPGFGEHNGDSAKERSLKNQRQARWRDKKSGKSVDANVDVPASTTPSTREEKRREEKDKSREPAGSDCPQAAIVSLYHELLPANPRMKVWDGDRAKALRARWREDSKRQDLDYWRRFFIHVSASPFLTGQVDGQGGRPFLPGLDWLVKPSNFAKVIENRYHDGAKP